MSLRLSRRCRVVVDNDWAGNPDGLVALAHHLLSPGHRVDAITSSLLDPSSASPIARPAGGAALPNKPIARPAGGAALPNKPIGRTADGVALAERPIGRAAEGAALAEELVSLIGAECPVHVGSEELFRPGAAISSAAEAIIDAARSDDALPLFVVCGGPLTNVAAALAAAPDIAGRMTLVWVGGSRPESPEPGAAAEYNRDTDAAAAVYVLGHPGLAIRQFPLETYRQLAYSVDGLEHDLGGCGPLGAWLWARFVELPLPERLRVDAVRPLADSALLIGTAFSDESSSFETVENHRIYTRIDARLVLGDMLARFRLHARS